MDSTLSVGTVDSMFPVSGTVDSVSVDSLISVSSTLDSIVSVSATLDSAVPALPQWNQLSLSKPLETGLGVGD